jgi:CRP-like cAMP-binding protein
MVMAPRWQRVVVSLAGPIAGVTVAGVAMLVMVTTSDPIVAALAFQASTLLVFAFVLNLLPILDLDGYHVLIDALDAPLLRQRAIGFFRAGAPRKLRRREKWSASEVLLATYGGLAIVASIGMLLFAVWIWRSRIGPLAAELAGSGPLGTLAVVIVLLVFIGPIVLGLAMKIAGAGQMALRTVAARAARDEKARLIERIGVLRRVRFLANLTPQALAALADHIVVERAEPGDVVVTYGEPADKFYIVRSGQLEAVAPDGRPLHRIIPGEGLGELALLDGTPRTATVRATQPTVLWSIDRGHFHRWVRDRYEVAARIRASEEERARLQRLPFFQHLGPQELERLAAKLVTQRVPAGEDVVRAGEPGDRYYIIREGTAEVTDPDGRPIRTLGPDQDFGELALLFGGPRTATVRALTDLVVVSLARKDFAALVQASGETHGQFRQRTAHYENAPGLGSTIAKAGS